MIRPRIILSLILLLLTFQASFGHPWKPSHYVIIDTDGGIDDIKAINMLLASRDVRVLAIIASGGTLRAENSYIKVRSLLDSFHHEGLPVGINTSVKGEDYMLPLSVIYGDETSISVPASSNYIDLVRSVVSGESSPIKLVSLGSLNSAVALIKEGIALEGIYWSIASLEPAGGMNYDLDPESADKIIKGDVPLHGVGYTSDDQLYSNEIINLVSGIGTRYAGSVYSLLGSVSPVSTHSYARRGNDDMVPLYLHYPELFSTVQKGNNSFSVPAENRELQPAILKILSGETVAMNQVVKVFPGDSSFYMPDVQPYVNTIIDMHGIDEWSSGVLANELHRHLGVFAIVGVKMGIRAREYFNTGVDEMNLISYAGSIPPLSCMNDGLQVSTGGTPGHGLLDVRDENTSPSAEFIYKGRILRITLKPEIASVISEELREINYVYGLDSNIYWELVRKNTIKYWLSLDRHRIFDIEEIK